MFLGGDLKVLLCVTKYSFDASSPYLTNDLVDELRNRGCDVDVFLLPWSGAGQGQGQVFVKKPFFYEKAGVLGLIGKWFLSSFKFFPLLVKKIILKDKYDFVVYFSPSAVFGPSLLLTKFLTKNRFCIYWDFFPIHNYEIGMPIPKVLLTPLRLYERVLNEQYDSMLLMSPRNVKFYREYFNSNRSLDILQVWRNTSGLTMPVKSISNDKPYVSFVFGGQLVEGRGINEMLESFCLALKTNSNMKLFVLGSGKLSDKVQQYSKCTSNKIEFVGHVNRDEYMTFISECDVGVVSTVPNVSVPSYPSKALDYMAAGLPLAISVEPTSDFGAIAKDNNYGLYCSAGDINGFSKIFLSYADSLMLRHEHGRNGFDYLVKNHSVKNTVDILITSCCKI